MSTPGSDAMEAIAPASDLRLQETFDEPAIAALAYALWQARGCPQGSPDNDWFDAIELLESRNRGQQVTGPAT